MKDQVESNTVFLVVEKNLDSIGLLTIIKKLVYTRGIIDQNLRYNKAMAHMNLKSSYQEHFKTCKSLETSKRHEKSV